ncbi:MAG: hypothetical protein ACLTY5_07960 [Angelakisella sp.]
MEKKKRIAALLLAVTVLLVMLYSALLSRQKLITTAWARTALSAIRSMFARTL